MLGRYATFRGLSKPDADDLAASTLEVAWRKFEQVPRDDPLPWLYAVAHNLLRNHRRATRRAALFQNRLPPPQPEPGPTASSTSAKPLLMALGTLSEDDQEILRLVAWDDLSPSQAAVVLGCSPVAARSRLHRARRRLARTLAADATLQQGQSPGHERGEGAHTTPDPEVSR